MYKTHIFTKFSAITLKSKLIFNGMLPFIPHKGMGLDITSDHGTEMVRDVSYDIINNAICVTIESPDAFNNYPEVSLDVPEKPVISRKCTFLDYFKELEDCLCVDMRLGMTFNQKGFIIHLFDVSDNVLAALNSESEEGFQVNYTLAHKYVTDYWADVLDVVEHLNHVWDGIWHEFIPH